MSAESKRVLSVDALRGFDMIWIMGLDSLLRNLPKAWDTRISNFLATQMDHVEWTGFHFYDIIMPLFLFIVGVAMPFSIFRRKEKGEPKSKIYFHVIRRVIILWIFGMMVQGNLLSYSWNEFRFYSNTLQAIAAGYLISAVLLLETPKKVQLFITAGLLLVYWLCMAFIPVPGAGAGIYTPQTNLAIYIDKAILGSHQDGTTYTWILSSLNFGATTMLGVFAGYVIKGSTSGIIKVGQLCLWGAVLIALGMVWDLIHPIVKHLWTSSFVLFSGGLCFLLLAFFYFVIDVVKLKGWAFPFIVVGSNAIVAYMLGHLIDFRTIGDVFVGGLAKYTGAWQEIIRWASHFLIIYGILYYLYRQKIFLKI